MPTTRELLDEAAGALRASGIDTPRLDAELLLAMAIGVGRTAVVAHADAPVGADAERTFRTAIDRRLEGEPIAYLRGLREFRGIALAVDARALIPRPETELLVELALAELVRRLAAPGAAHGAAPGAAHGAAEARPLRVADVGTGSGAIAIALAVALRARGVTPEALDILATDISPDALDVARDNAVGHALGNRMRLMEVDLLPPLPVPATGSADAHGWDVIVANLPYIRSADLATLPAPVRHEPALALDGGADGLAVIDRLLERLPSALDGHGVALLEIGADQGTSIGEHVAALLPGWSCRVHADLAGLPRVAVVERMVELPA